MVQLRLQFQTENNMLPKDFDRVIVSFFKAASESYSNEFYNSLYDKSKSIIKSYTYSKWFRKPSFQKECIMLSNNEFSLFFSDSNPGELIQFFNSFRKMKMKAFPMKGNTMKLVSISAQNRQQITDSEIIIKMHAPLIARRHNSDSNTDCYYVYNHPEFPQVIKENVEFFIQKTSPELSLNGFSITPIKGKKVVAPSFYGYIDASLGVYKLTGSPELLNVLYLSGIGSRRSSGAGKWEVVL